MEIPILVVEANPEYYNLIRQNIEKTGGFKITHAIRAMEALMRLTETQFRAAIVDLKLPDLHGRDLIRQMHGISEKLMVIAILDDQELQQASLDDLRIAATIDRSHAPQSLPGILAAQLQLTPSLEADHSEISEPLKSPVQIKQSVTPSIQSAAARQEAHSSAPPWLQSAPQAKEFLLKLQREHNAHTAMLVRSAMLWSVTGQIDDRQVDDIVKLLAKLDEGLKTQGAIIRYIRFSGEESDHLLYACPLIEDILLALVYPPETSFSLARREAQKLSRTLLHQDPKTFKAVDDVQKSMPVALPDQDDRELLQPSHWIPGGPVHSKSTAPIKERSAASPPPEPLAAKAEMPPERQPFLSAPLPEDWLPKQPKPLSHLPFLEEDQAEFKREGESATLNLPKQEAKYYLPFTVALLPRFPEHSLGAPIAEQLETWLRRLCIAWGWRVESIDVQQGLLLFTVGLSPEDAPAEAILQLAQDLSARIIRSHPNLAQDLPSGYFWAKRYLLSSGSSISADRLAAFITSTRQDQGLTQ